MLKGTIVVFFAGFLELSNFEITVICMSCVLGHIFPIFYKFKGGKGVATGLGSLLAFDIVLGSICIITWLTMLKIYGFSSLAAIVTFFLLPLHVFFTYNSFKVTAIIVMMSAIIIWRHKDNIQNLVNKTESKIGKK
jgi:glycerol-3-phosphate acyltransferase PlsY